jgi:class 3 adenylate cyclase
LRHGRGAYAVGGRRWGWLHFRARAERITAVAPTVAIDGLGAFVPHGAREDTLPRVVPGSVLEADVVGFTPLTERLARRHGPRRGAEEIAALLDAVYGALIAQAEAFGGEVVEFRGDAILCCFAGDDGTAAAHCGLAMQRALATLGDECPAVRVAIGVGAVRRLTLGDPAERLHALLAGPALDELLRIAPLAEPGEVVVTAARAAALTPTVTVAGRRGAATVLEGREDETARGSTRRFSATLRAPEDARVWLGPRLVTRLEAGVRELRSVVALFIRFAGEDELDANVRTAQATVSGFGGDLLSVAVDAKGSYACVGFGAVVAHDDDPQRAAAAALALAGAARGAGLAAGRVYVGTYGGPTRRAFGLQGTPVNLAARLMQAAGPGEVIVHEPLARRLEGRYAFGPSVPLAVKGHHAVLTTRRLHATAPGRDAAAAGHDALVGRDTERARLEALVRDVLNGRGGAVLIEGEPGIGKTRLAAHLAERAAALGVEVLGGGGDPIERGAPYHGWRAILGEAGAPEGDEAQSEAARDRLVAVLAARAAAAPTLIVLEDAHWLDSASLTVALRLAAEPGPLLLAVTTRDVGNSDARELTELTRLPGLVRLRLAPLAADEAVELAVRTLGVPLPAGAVALIEHKAGGNPLFSRELALALREHGLLAADGRGDDARLDARIHGLESPDTVEAVIASRVDRLPAAAQTVLKVASVLGPAFQPATLARLADGSVATAVAELTRHELLVARGDALAFRHALIRDVVYERQLHAQRRALHRRAAELLEAEGASAATLAHHWDRAEVPDRAATWLGRAGESAMRAGAARECAAALERALKLTGGEAEDGRRARWTYTLSHAHYRLGDLEQSIAFGEAAIAALDRPVPARSPAVLRAVLGEVRHQLRRGSGVRPSPGAQERLAAEAVFALGEVYYAAADKPRSMYVSLRALNLAERHGPSRELAACYGAMAIICGLIGLHPLARRYARRAEATSQALGDPASLALTAQQLAWYGVSTGPYEAFAARFEDATARCRALGHKPRLRDALGCGGIGDLLFGRHAGARAKLTEILRTAEPQERSIWMLWAPLFLAELELRDGHPQQALVRLQATERRTRPEGIDMTEFQLTALTALALWRLRRDADARRYEHAARAARRRAGALPTVHAELPAYVARAELALARWDETRAARDRRAAVRACWALAVFARMFAIGRPAQRLYAAELAYRRHRYARAVELWRAALVAATRLDMRYEQALAHAALADRLRTPEAAAHQRAARDAFAALGLPSTRRAVQPR